MHPKREPLGSVAVFLVAMIFIGFLSRPSHAAEGQNTPLATREVQPVVKAFIKKIVFIGNSVVSTADLNKLVAPYENTQLSYEDAVAIAKKITDEYHQRGYFIALAYVNHQKIHNGVLRINVIEGRIGKVIVKGNHVYSTKYILYLFRPAILGGVLHYETLQKQIMILNESSDFQVAVTLQPGEVAETTDVILNVTDSAPSHIDGDFNNFGSRTGGQHQPSLTFTFGNFLKEGAVLTMQPLWPYPNSSTDFKHPIFSTTYSIPVNNHGTLLTAGYSSADVRLGSELDVLNVVGNTNITNIGLTQDLSRTDSHSSNFMANFYIKSAHNSILDQPTSRDVLREFAVTYNINWVSGSGSNLYDCTFMKGLGTLFNGEANDDPLSSVPGAGNDFSKINMDLYRFQSLGSGILAIFRASGQYAFAPLTQPEQYLAGGSESVRGYRPAEIVGDTGWNGTLEFRIPAFTKPKSSLQFELFSDMASAYTRLTPGATKSLWGGGFGFRYSSGDATAIRLELGFPLTPFENSTMEKPVLYADFSTRFY